MGKIGQRQRSPMTGDARERMWKAMRHLRTFTSCDIQATAEAGEDNVRKYIASLAEADYLHCTSPRARGFAGGHATWRLVRNTGPLAPRVSIDGLYDANLAEPIREVSSLNVRMRPHALRLLKIVLTIADAAERNDATQRARAEAEAREFAAMWSATA